MFKKPLVRLASSLILSELTNVNLALLSEIVDTDGLCCAQGIYGPI